MRLLAFIWIHLESVVAAWHTRSDEFFNSDWFDPPGPLTVTSCCFMAFASSSRSRFTGEHGRGTQWDSLEFRSRPVWIQSWFNQNFSRCDNDIFWNCFPFAIFSMNYFWVNLKMLVHAHPYVANNRTSYLLGLFAWKAWRISECLTERSTHSFRVKSKVI